MSATRRHALGLAAASLALPSIARAQGSRALRVIVPYPAGGPTDAIGRLAAKELSDALGQPAVVENVAGASGTLGTRLVARSAPDGQTLVLGTSQSHATVVPLVRDLPYDPVRDFAPVAGLVDLQHALVVANDLPVRTVPDLVAHAAARGGSLNYGSTGIGSLSHLGMELLRRRLGSEMVHVPFSGSAPLFPEIVAGRIHLSYAPLAAVLGQVRGGLMRAIAVPSAQRAPQMPDPPLLRDEGITGCDADSWLGLWAPARTPQAVVDRLSGILQAAFARPDVVERARSLGFVVNLRSPGELEAHVQAEVRRWGDVIRAAAIAAE